MTDGQPWLDEALTTLDANRRMMLELLDRHGLGGTMHLPQATYLAWLDLRRFQLPDVRRQLLERAGVATTAGEEHGRAGAGFVRINFATPKDVLAEAVERIAEALPSNPARRAA